VCGWSASESVCSGGSSTLGVSTHAGFLPRPDPPRLSAGRASPIPPQDLTSPVAPNGHRRGFHARRRTPCRNPFEPRGYRPGQDHSSRIPVRVTRLAIQDAFDWFDPDPHRAGNDHSDEQQAPYFQVIWTPFRNRQQTRPVTADGPPLFATPRRYRRHPFGRRWPSGRRHLLPISATNELSTTGTL
jgi:hypothetical protein